MNEYVLLIHNKYSFNTVIDVSAHKQIFDHNHNYLTYIVPVFLCKLILLLIFEIHTVFFKIITHLYHYTQYRLQRF